MAPVLLMSQSIWCTHTHTHKQNKKYLKKNAAIFIKSVVINDINYENEKALTKYRTKY